MANNNTNMDLNKKKMKDGPALEFTLQLNELLDQFRVGETGKIVIPVEITQVDKESVSFRKNGEAEVLGNMRSKTLSEMREDIGTVADFEEDNDKEEDK